MSLKSFVLCRFKRRIPHKYVNFFPDNSGPSHHDWKLTFPHKYYFLVSIFRCPRRDLCGCMKENACIFVYENLQVYPYYNLSFELGVWPEVTVAYLRFPGQWNTEHESVLILAVALCTHLCESAVPGDLSAWMIFILLWLDWGSLNLGLFLSVSGSGQMLKEGE